MARNGPVSVPVLAIPEDPTLNGHILKPLVQALLADAGRPTARVKILENPRVRGYDDALNAIRHSLHERYGWFALWLFFPDADRGSSEAMRKLESDLQAEGVLLLCCPAEPEVEIYACAAFRGYMNETWSEARKNPRMKEEVFQPLLEIHGDSRRVGGGRDLMIRKSLKNLPLLYRLCPELRVLRDQIAALVRDQYV